MDDKIYECKTGKYIILNKEPSVNGRSMVKIRFLETGNEYVVRKDHALIGNVREPSMKRGRIPNEIDFGKIYESNYGQVRIIREIKEDATDGYRPVEIEFTNSGYRKIVNYYNSFRNSDFVYIRDDSIYNENHLVGTDKLYDSNNYGKFKILRYTGEMYGSDPIVEIEFEFTKYRTTVPMNKALNGIVKDIYYPCVCGVGYFGENPDASNNKKEYSIWYKMLSRCYNELDPAYQFYGAVGVSVDPSWLNFSTFIEDIKYLDGYDQMINNPKQYAMDKDLKQLQIPKNQRVYSKDTCTFITKSDNSKIRCYEEYYEPYETLMMPRLTVSNSLKTMCKIINNKKLKY